MSRDQEDEDRQTVLRVAGSRRKASLWLRSRARAMRNSPTFAEERMWTLLRKRRLLGLKFRRQHVVGSYIVDFFCCEMRLAVEVDGPIHRSTRARDAARDVWIREHHLTVLRFTNRDVLEDIDFVFGVIHGTLLRLQEARDQAQT